LSERISIAGDGAQRARATLERCVADGGVAVFPADTVYGLACDPSRSDSVERIRDLKGREEGKPSAVMFFSPLAMRELLSALGPRTREALGALLPGPVTVVVANPERRYPLASPDDPERLGIRLIGGPLAGTRCAILQTSANPSGEATPHSLGAVAPSILAGADLAIDGGELPGTASTVVDISEIEAESEWRILREGALPRRELDRRLATVIRSR
jgi:L-threonylcarbamoyladenylate synthase